MAKSKIDDYVDKAHDYGLYIPTRTIFMFGETEVDMTSEVIKNLHILENLNLEPITIIMSNVGGDEIEGMGLYDAIKACKSHVTIIVQGHAMSMGSIILQAADTRIMSANSKFMMHYGTPMLADSDLHAKEQHSWFEENKKFTRWMEDFYLEKIKDKKPYYERDDIINKLNFATILDAKETVEMGLADKVLGEDV